MAKSFGGKYSPSSRSGRPEVTHDAAPATPRGHRSAPGTWKATVLFIPAVVLAVLSINEGAIGLVTGLSGAALLILAAWLTREGIAAQAAFDARKIARRPAMPRKMVGSVLTGVGIGLASIMNDPSIVAAVLFGIVAAALHSAAFGFDPLRDKRMEGIDTFQQDRVARVVDQAEGHLKAMWDHVARIGDRPLERRVERFQQTAKKMIWTVEEDPRDLTAARKFLGVYLMGARDAAAKFADLYTRKKDDAARADFEALLDDLEQNFAARTEKMLLDDKSDMDIEIKVLRDRLQREGLVIEQE